MVRKLIVPVQENLVTHDTVLHCICIIIRVSVVGLGLVVLFFHVTCSSRQTHNAICLVTSLHIHM